jgi:hypothetical protein
MSYGSGVVTWHISWRLSAPSCKRVARFHRIARIYHITSTISPKTWITPTENIFHKKHRIFWNYVNYLDCDSVDYAFTAGILNSYNRFFENIKLTLFSLFYCFVPMKWKIRTISSELYTPYFKKLQSIFLPRYLKWSAVSFDILMTLYQNKLQKEYPSIHTIRPRV